MRIRNLHRSSPFLVTSSAVLPTVEASFPDALISNTLAVLRMKSFTEYSPAPAPAPVVLNYQHQCIEPQSNLLSMNLDRAGVLKANDNADDCSDSAELMQTPPFPAIPNKEDVEELEKLRVCTVNKSPWDVPSFVRAFLTKPTSEPAGQSMQNNSSSERKNEKKNRGALIPNIVSPTNAIAEAKHQVQFHVEDDDDFNKTEIGRLEYKCKAAVETNTLSCGMMLQVTEEEQMLESELVRVFSEEVAGLTVREAGCKLMLRNVSNIISEGLPLSVQVRRAMLNSPYFVQLDDGKFALWDNFLNSTVGSLDKQEITSLEIEKRMGTHKFDREEDCASSKEPNRGQLDDTNLELAVPKIVTTKGKRGRREGSGLGLVKNMRVRDEEKEEIGCCKKDGKRRNSGGQKVEQRSYDSGNNGATNDSNNYSWDKDTVVPSDSQCYGSQSSSDGNGEASQNVVPPWDERYRAAASLISCSTGNIGIRKELHPTYCRKRKPVKARSLKALL